MAEEELSAEFGKNTGSRLLRYLLWSVCTKSVFYHEYIYCGEDLCQEHLKIMFVMATLIDLFFQNSALPE